MYLLTGIQKKSVLNNAPFGILSTFPAPHFVQNSCFLLTVFE